MKDKIGATWEEMMKTRESLAKDPELRRRIEKEINDKITDGSSFNIYEIGIGHFAGSLHISSKGV